MLVRRGRYTVTGEASTAHAIEDGEVITRPLSNGILHQDHPRLAAEDDGGASLKLVEDPFTIAEAQRADEAFYTSASSFMTPIVEVDGGRLGSRASPARWRSGCVRSTSKRR